MMTFSRRQSKTSRYVLEQMKIYKVLIIVDNIICRGRKMKTIKPLLLMNDDKLSGLEKRAVLNGANELLRIAGANGIAILDMGAWKDRTYLKSDNTLREYCSVDWYMQEGRRSSQKGDQINADVISHHLTFEPWRETKDHYDLMTITSDMYSRGTNFVIGLAHKGIGTLISTFRFRGLNDYSKYECIKTETMHELGHVFGLLPEYRTQDVEDSLGKHCTNLCIMRQGIKLPDDWVRMTNDRLIYGALCNDCRADLRNFFL